VRGQRDLPIVRRGYKGKDKKAKPEVTVALAETKTGMTVQLGLGGTIKVTSVKW
jgi:hypothetical protein